jgi:hypothetical protein
LLPSDSRARHFQIRGIGERSGYERTPNSAVGFLIDDIDYSGQGGIATTFDVEQIEVHRGPSRLKNRIQCFSWLNLYQNKRAY